MGLFTLTEDCETAIDEWSGEVGKPSSANRGRTRIRVFKNGFIEDWFATAHWTVPGLWSIPVVLGISVYSYTVIGLLPTLSMLFYGVLFWTLMEYVLHRWLFHRRPSSWHFDKVQMFMLHGYHHEFPNDPWRLVAPPIMSWPGAVIVGTLQISILGWTYGLPLLAGTILGYLAYDWIHYYEHHGRPTSKVAKWMRRLHSIHHFNDPEVNHGISSPLWDGLFATYRDSKKAKQPTHAEENAAK